MECGRRTLLFLLPVLALLLRGVAGAGLREAFSWGQLRFSWPSEEAHRLALSSQAFRPSNNIPVGLEVWGGRVFVTVPRWAPGVAASLATFQLNGSSVSPALVPYPDWASHNISAPSWSGLRTRLVSPFRLRADSCGRLWVLDTGVDDVLGESRTLAAPALLVFDLRTDRLLRRYEFPREQVKDSSFLVNVAVDVVQSGCDRAFAYVADMGSFALLVYSWAEQRSWRVTHNYFLSHPLQGDFAVHGTRFQWPDGIFGLALSKPNRFGHRTLYFHAFASTSEFQVSTEILQNETRSQNSFHEFHLIGDRGPNSQSCASFMDEETAIVFYTQVNKDAITCWNSHTRPHYRPATIGIVAQDNRTLIFPNDVKVDQERNLWVLSDRLPLFLFGQLDAKDVNFRILTATVQEAVNGTICDPDYAGPELPHEDDLLGDRFGGATPHCQSVTGAATRCSCVQPLLAVAAMFFLLLLTT